MTRTGWPALAPLTAERSFGFVDRPRPAESAAFAAAATVVVAGLGLIDPRRLSGGRQAAYRLASSTVAGAYTAATAPANPLADTPMRTAVGIAAGGLTLGLADQAEALDARLADWLADRGVARPRWVLAGLGAAAVLAGYAWDRAEANRWRAAVGAAEGAAAEDDVRPASPEVRELLEALLVDGVPGVAALRRQLGSLQERVQGPGFLPDAWFAVDPHAPRVSPRTQSWPVVGRFRWDGTWFEAHLQVHHGHVDSLALVIAEDQDGAEPDWDVAQEQLTRWPRAEELQIVVEAADPLS